MISSISKNKVNISKDKYKYVGFSRTLKKYTRNTKNSGNMFCTRCGVVRMCVVRSTKLELLLPDRIIPIMILHRLQEAINCFQVLLRNPGMLDKQSGQYKIIPGSSVNFVKFKN